MKNFIQFLMTVFVFWVGFNSTYAQGKLTAEELLAKSIEFHDPEHQWNQFKSILNFDEQQPEKAVRKTQVHIDNSTGYFKLNRGDEEISGMSLDSCFIIKGSVSCQRAEMMRDYYLYLWGLPMKLKDANTPLQPTINTETIKGIDYFTIQVNYPKDTWTFFLNKEDYSLQAYRFIKPDKSGELIELADLVSVGAMRIPKTRKWFALPQNNYIATDILMTSEGY